MFTGFIRFTIGWCCNKQHTTEITYSKQKKYGHSIQKRPNGLGNQVAVTTSLN